CDDYPETAFMSVSNHASFFDPWLISYPSKQPVSIMMNEDGFKAKAITRWYLEKVGTFPKKKGATDVRAMKTALKRLKANSPLLIFPEGQTSWDGETQPIFPGIEKLVKRTKLPLLMINLSGNFISRPWWSSVNRKGTIIVSRKVVSAETLNSMSPEEVSKMITDYIYN
ncbi:MAG: 1-acyl-sn-glycerol-3-phosphate acyltransferase, partial [Proteobacteria bacterium]|nr:1-acyl-sn-glycerol-3-phosphate acyltransferase [Pseudomonadota bacterium]